VAGSQGWVKTLRSVRMHIDYKLLYTRDGLVASVPRHVHLPAKRGHPQQYDDIIIEILGILLRGGWNEKGFTVVQVGLQTLEFL
jgi:hypothetical protein